MGAPPGGGVHLLVILLSFFPFTSQALCCMQ